MGSYIGQTSIGDSLVEDIRSEANGEIAAAEAGIRDRTLVQLTRTLLDTVGDKEGLIRDLFRWVPATLYDNAICTNFATVVSVLSVRNFPAANPHRPSLSTT